MFNLTGSELIVIVLLGLIVLGPEKLPGAIRRVGRLYLELKRLSSGFQEEFRTAFEEPIRELRSTADTLKSTIESSATDENPTRTDASTNDETPTRSEEAPSGDSSTGAPAAPAQDRSGDDEPAARDETTAEGAT